MDVFLIWLILGEIEAPSTKFVLLQFKFSDVFPNDLQDMSLDRDQVFCIGLGPVGVPFKSVHIS